MPNTSVRAAAEGMPDVNRRSFLRGIPAAGAMVLVASVPAVVALTGAANKPRESLEELLNQLPPEVAAELRAKFIAILEEGLARVRAGENKYVVLADVRAQIRAV
jgi:hypothetical protein